MNTTNVFIHEQVDLHDDMYIYAGMSLGFKTVNAVNKFEKLSRNYYIDATVTVIYVTTYITSVLYS